MGSHATPVRRLGLVGAAGIGVGSMLGAGVFVVWGPAVSAAGPWLLAAAGCLVLAVVVRAAVRRRRP